MELDELKKSWNALDEQLKKEPIADEKQIAGMIAEYKANARKSIGRLTGWQRFSIGIGVVGLALLLVIWLLPSIFQITEEWQPKINTLVIFVGISILIGIWWDHKNYRWIRNTRIDEMPVAIVSKRMASFRRWTRYEIIAITVWVIIFNVLNYWVMGYYKASFGVQATLIAFFVLCDVAIIYLLYKKVAYKHLNDIKNMHRITLLLILFLLIPDAYIYFMYIIRKTKNIWLRIAHWIPTLLLIAGYFLLMQGIGENAMAHHAQAIGRLAIAIFLFAIPKTIFMICSLVGLPFHYLLRWPRSPFTAIGLVLGVVSFFNILYGTLVGISKFEVKEIEFHHPNLPKAFDGYRIVQLSDIHIGSWIENEKPVHELVKLVNEQEPDLIVFTGDLVNQRSCELEGFQNILSQLHAKDGVYSILGNHDYGSYYRWKDLKEQVNNLDNLVRMEKTMGWKLLNNEHTTLYHQGDSIALIGVENDGEPPFSQFADLKKATEGTDGMFRVLLSHNPTHWRREVLPNTDIELMLAGHTHAMQAIMFGHSLASLIYPEWGGMYTEGDRGLYVNIGIGYVGLPFRFGAWPEITVLTLRN